MNFWDSVQSTIQHVGGLAYWIVFLLSLLESTAFMGFVIPGGAILAFTAFLASRGYLNPYNLVWFASVGAILGDSLSYWIGSKGIKFFRNENRFLKLSHLDKTRVFFDKHGNKSVFLGRFTPFKPMIAFVAGLAKMEMKRFMFWNIASGLMWAAAHVLLGYFFGGALKLIETWSTRIIFLLIVLAAVIAIVWAIIKKSGPVFSFTRSLLLSVRDAVATNPEFNKFVARYPRVFRFLRARLRLKDFAGLPLTMLGLSLIYLIALFAGIVEDVVTSDVITSLDIRIENLLYVFRDGLMNKIFFWITLLGESWIIIIFGIIVSIIFWISRKRTYIWSLWVTMLCAAGVTAVAKLIVHRPRPVGNIPYYIEGSYSFPSGHATAAAAFYGFLIYFFIRNFAKWRYKINAVFLGVIVILGVGFSRLYLGVHFLSDVLGGYLIGSIWLVIGITLTEWLLSLRVKVDLEKRSRDVTLMSVLFGVSALIVYTFAGFYYEPPLNTSKDEQKYMQISGNVSDLLLRDDFSKYSEGIEGAKAAPMSFIIVAKDDADLAGVFKKAGWYEADPVSFGSAYKIAKAAIWNEAYPTAPMTPAFWGGEVNDFNFQKPTDKNTVRERHHSRFWKTDFMTKDGQHTYIGTASLDTGLKWGLTHTISPDLDTERAVMFQDLENSGYVSSYTKAQFTEPTLGQNFSGDQFFTDGKGYVVLLK